MSVRPYPPTHRYCGSNPERQSVGDPGHCEDCAQHGHVLAHPDLGCGDVGCNALHGPEDERAALVAAIEVAEADLHQMHEQAQSAYRAYRDLDAAQTRKADEIRELKRILRESSDG